MMVDSGGNSSSTGRQSSSPRIVTPLRCERISRDLERERGASRWIDIMRVSSRVVNSPCSQPVQRILLALF